MCTTTRVHLIYTYDRQCMCARVCLLRAWDAKPQFAHILRSVRLVDERQSGVHCTCDAMTIWVDLNDTDEVTSPVVVDAVVVVITQRTSYRNKHVHFNCETCVCVCVRPAQPRGPIHIRRPLNLRLFLLFTGLQTRIQCVLFISSVNLNARHSLSNSFGRLCV